MADLILVLFFNVFIGAPDPGMVNESLCLHQDENKLVGLINDYRKSRGLHPVAVSSKLTQVARAHADDLNSNYEKSKKCNPHSWSEHGDWTACCYTNDGKAANCMWDKPREIANYSGRGYEIVYWVSSTVTPERALEGWKKSPGHNQVIVNQGMWNKAHWRSMGVAVQGQYAIIWFGEEADAAEVIRCR